MTDANHRGGPPGSNLGDGDLADPEFAGMDDADLAVAPATAGAAAAGAARDMPMSADDASAEYERASEIDDVTAAFSRPSEVDYSEVDVPALLAEREEYKTMAQRIQADFDNYRRQSAVRAQADADRATSRLAEAMLPVLDAAEAAYLEHPDEIGPLLNQMLLELKKQGLETLDLDGQPFDPEVAEAVVHEPASGGEAVIAEVLRSGYRWKGKTLRAAMVKTTD